MEKKIDYVVSLLKSLSDAKNNTEILKIEEEIIEVNSTPPAKNVTPDEEE